MRCVSSLVLPTVTVSALLSVTSCGVQPGIDQSSVIGGTVASADQFPATVQINGACGGVRVGPRHVLTARHCIDDNFYQAQIQYRKGSTVSLRATDGSTQDLTVESLNESEFNILSGTLTEDGPSKDTDSADLAVLIFEQEIPSNVATATIDTTPVAAGTPVTVVGYGCRVEGEEPDGRLSFRETRAEAGDALAGYWLHHFPATTGSSDELISSEEDAALAQDPRGYWDSAIKQAVEAAVSYSHQYDGNFWFTSDTFSSTSEGQYLCEGDSGAPVYRSDDPLRVIGINSRAVVDDWGLDESFVFDNCENLTMASVDFHSRLDDGSLHGAANWLRGLGVNIHEAEEPAGESGWNRSDVTAHYAHYAPRCKSATADEETGGDVDYGDFLATSLDASAVRVFGTCYGQCDEFFVPMVNTWSGDWSWCSCTEECVEAGNCCADRTEACPADGASNAEPEAG